MNSAMAISLLLVAFVGALMALLPHISPHRYFFAITVPPGFRATAEGRAAMRRYQMWVAAGVALSLAAAVALNGRSADGAFLVAMLLPAAVGFGAYLRERSALSRYAAPLASVREAGISGEDDHLPRCVGLALPPFAAPLAAAAYLRAHWDEIPARFPVHFDAAGEANRWVDKTPRGVYGPLLVCGAMLLMILLISLAMFHGARRGPQRTAIVKIVVAGTYLLAILFSLIGLMPLGQFSPMMLVAPTVVYVLIVVTWIYRMVRDPNMPADATPDECWHLGAVYFNRQGPAVFVQKRMGFGYTFNFGNGLSWLFIDCLVAGVAGMVLVLP